MIDDAPLAEMERLIRRDPARRGLISSESEWGPLCPGHLAHAARHLAEYGRRAIVVTGFFIPSGVPPAAETDGPPGAALLAAALRAAGLAVQIVTDEPCRSAVEIAVREMQLPATTVCVIPIAREIHESWMTNLIEDSDPEPLTHLISLERVGPSHTSSSIREQPRASAASLTEAIDEFERLVPEHDQDRCHNMRGECIDAHTAPLHRLFEIAAQHGNIHTIGIGDGGNEIGMGSIPWEELCRRLFSARDELKHLSATPPLLEWKNGPSAARVPCRIGTDWTIVTGVSNWGGQALAAATLLLKRQTEAMRDWTMPQQRHLLECVVREGPAVDGITRLQEPTVDGLPFLTYIQPWEGLRRLIGFSD